MKYLDFIEKKHLGGGRGGVQVFYVLCCVLADWHHILVTKRSGLKFQSVLNGIEQPDRQDMRQLDNILDGTWFFGG